MANELVGLRVGLHKGTTAEEFVRQINGLKEVKLANNNVELFDWLARGVIDGALYDHIRSHAEIVARPEWVSRLFSKDDFTIQVEEYGIAFARVNGRLREDIDAILKTKKDDVKQIFESRM